MVSTTVTFKEQNEQKRFSTKIEKYPRGSVSLALLLNPGKNFCSYPDCKSLCKTKGLCKRHGGGSRCKMVGCTSSAKTGGYCIRHGGGKKCSIDDCKTGARTANLCTYHFKKFVRTLCSLQELYITRRQHNLLAHNARRQPRAYLPSLNHTNTWSNYYYEK